MNQDKELESIKQTYPKMKLITHLEFARLYQPEKFPVLNKPRLYREVSDKILQAMLDLHYALKQLPESYKSDIILNPNFTSMMSSIFSASQIEKLRQEEVYPKLPNEKPDNTISVDLYQKFFNIGLEGLIGMFPNIFSIYLKTQMKPLLLLMLAISQTAKVKRPISLEFPSWVYEDRSLSLINP